MSDVAQPPQEGSRHAAQHDENSNSRRRRREPRKISRDAAADTMKIPDPIIEPMTIMVASIVPSARMRPDDDRSFAVLLVINDEARMTNNESMAKQERGSLAQSAWNRFGFRHSDFLRHSSFGFRHSLCGALILTPSRSSCVRNSRANSTAPGVSPWTQTVSPRTSTS
jgi:hypothetical protein